MILYSDKNILSFPIILLPKTATAICLRPSDADLRDVGVDYKTPAPDLSPPDNIVTTKEPH